MADSKKKSGSWRIWPDALLIAGDDDKNRVTSADVVNDLSIEASSACQVLRRLQSWGLLRVAAFAPATGPERRGRRRKVYELTKSGHRKVDRIRKAHRA